jgi:hypothetical protein
MDDPVLETAIHTEAIVGSSEKGVPSVESAATNSEIISAEVDPNVVDFDENDAENPLNWPMWRKWSIVWCTATMLMLTYASLLLLIMTYSSL